MSSTKDVARSEEGITLPLFVMTLAVIIGIVSIVVDVGKQELSLMQLRQAADAAALSGARQLNGRPDGWRAAKLASSFVVKRYPIHGVDGVQQAQLRLQSGPRSYWDGLPASTPDYLVDPIGVNVGTGGDAGSYHVTVERGIYRAKLDDSAHTEFVSLESVPNGEIMASSSYVLANAVRVHVKLDHLPGFFSKIFNSLGFYNLEATSYAVMDSRVNERILPIAFAVEDMMTDTNPRSNSQTRQTPYYVPEMHNGRPVIVSMVNLAGRLDSLTDNSLISRDKRILINEGLERYLSHAWPPYADFGTPQSTAGMPPDPCYLGQQFGLHPNCLLRTPLYGWFITKGRDVPTAEQIVQAFEGDGIGVQIGDRVTGLEDMTPFENNEELSQRLAGVFNRSSRTVRQEYFPGGSPLPHFRFLRTRVMNKDDDQIIQYPSLNNDNETQNFYMSNDATMGPGGTVSGIGVANFRNPNCFHPSLPGNDPDNAKVLSGLVALVAPRKSHLEDGAEIHYSDPSGMFSGAPQNAVVAKPITEPIVVGFARVNLTSFNFKNLEAVPEFHVPTGPYNEDVVVTTATPRYGIPGTPSFFADFNSAGLYLKEYVAKMKSYDKDVQDADEDCKTRNRGSGSRDGVCQNPGPPPLDNIGLLLNCFNIREKLGNDLDDLLDLVSGVSEIKPCSSWSTDECGVKDTDECPGGSQAGSCCDRICYGTGSSKLSYLVIRLLKGLDGEFISSQPDTHCLYVASPESQDRWNLDSYMPFGPVRAGYGCYGVEGTQAYYPRRTITASGVQEPVSIATGKKWSEQEPTLVNVSS